jgi:hypothetical protein
MLIALSPVPAYSVDSVDRLFDRNHCIDITGEMGQRLCVSASAILTNIAQSSTQHIEVGLRNRTSCGDSLILIQARETCLSEQ